MAKQRYIQDSFWTDPYVEKLDPSEKLLFLYYLTNPLCNIAGIYEIRNNRVAYETGFDKEMVEKIKNRFLEDGKVLVFKDWICMVNFIKNQTTNPSVEAGIKRIILSLPEEVQKTFFEDFNGGVKIKKRSVENFKIILKNNPFCKRCGETDRLEVDHITPIFLGGDNSLENLQVLCRSCHSFKSKEDLEKQPVTACPTLLNLTLLNSTKPGVDQVVRPPEKEVEGSGELSKQVPEVIKAMESIDPKNKLYYGNKTQRGACEFLIQEYGFEEVIKAVKIIPILKTRVSYFPSITTPVELRDKWVKVSDAIVREGVNKAKSTPEVAWG